MKILVTGAKGFTARNILEKLNGQYDLIPVTRKDLDLLDPQKVCQFIKKNHFDVIVHTATHDAVARGSTKDPAKVLENNLKMFFHIARCRDYFGKMIYFGSGAEFGREYWKHKMKEEYFDVHIPQDQYGLSKYIMTKYTEMSDNIYNLRLFGIFGKYDDWKTRFIPNICCYAAHNLPIPIEQDKLYDFLYIDDFVAIVKWFIDNKPKYKVYNACTGKTIGFKTIANKLIKISGKKLAIKIKKSGLGREYSGDNSRLLKEIKDFRFTPFDRALKNLYTWYDLNKNIIDINKLT